MVKKVAIIQPNFMPWWGYFKIISEVDEFIFLDDAQYTTRDWRNRNKIRTPSNWKWLTVPVDLSSGSRIPINAVLISKNNDARGSILKEVFSYYKNTRYFDDGIKIIEQSFENVDYSLCNLNIKLTQLICDYLKIKTKLTLSSDFHFDSKSSLKLLQLVKAVEGNIYVSGPNAMSYLDTKLFEESGVKVVWYKYLDQVPYEQAYPGFIPNLSIIDSIMNMGSNARSNFIISESGEINV